MNSRGSGVAVLVWVCVALGVLAVGVSSASAIEFGGEGEGAGQVGEPYGVAADQATGDVYVADRGNNRVDEFETNGTFVRAWGWGVDAAKPEARLQECTTATGCVHGEGGGGVGELDHPTGVAFDNVSGEPALYVEDDGNNRVQKFSPTGTFLRMFGGDVNKLTGGKVCTSAEAAECQPGTAGMGEGEFSELGTENAIVIGAAGAVYVGDSGSVQWFNPEGVREGGFGVSGGVVSTLAVAPSGNLFLTVSRNGQYFTDSEQGNATPEVREYSPSGKLEGTIVLETAKTGSFAEDGTVYVAVDGSGHLYVDEWFAYRSGELNRKEPAQIFEYDESLSRIAVFPTPGLGGEPKPGGFALFETAGRASQIVTVGYYTGVVAVVPAPPPGPVVGAEEANGDPGAAATLKAELNPEDHATKYHFEYGTEVGREVASAEGSLPASFISEKVAVKVEHLLPATVYHYHVVVEDGEGHIVEGPDETFETLPAFKLESVWSSDVSAEGAELEAAVDPLGDETEYYFEYAAAGEAEHRTQVMSAGASAGSVTVRAPVSGLAAHTAYGYRVVVRNTVNGKVSEALAQGELVTQHRGSPFALLDGREWEQVSPPQKEVAGITVAWGGGMVQAASDGSAVTYYAFGSSEANPEGEGALHVSQILSRHGDGGWSSRDLTTRSEQQRPALIGDVSGEYWVFSPGLERSLVEPDEFTPLSEWASEYTPYLREEAKCVEGASRECFLPLLTSTGPFADVEAGVKFGGQEAVKYPYVVGATPSLSYVVLHPTSQAISEPLVKGGNLAELYEWSPGQIVPVSVLPGSAQEPVSAGCFAELGAFGGYTGVGQAEEVTQNAISPDGSLVVWSDCERHVYMRDVADSETVQLDAVKSGASGTNAANAVFQGASVGDEHVFFMDSQRLTEDSTGVQGKDGAPTTSDLYEYDRAGNVVIDMTTPVNAGEAAAVQGVLGVSEDGSDVYVAARGVLTKSANALGASAVAGEDNVYLLEHGEDGWRAGFVATVSGEDAQDWGAPGESPGGHLQVARQTSSVSPDGRWLAFMSQRSLTGYDNRDAASGVPDEEVFLYDASTGRVVCASCNPTGARPHGILDQETTFSAPPLVDREEVWTGKRWLAGSLPTGYSHNISHEFALHRPRYLSNGGRLFFDSSDALVTGDVNHLEDVYEYEPPANGEIAGSDNCSAGASTYSAAAEGCVDLVSSGTSTEESAFLESSENGNDVFFLTAERLAPSDMDSTYDVYDAHVCGSDWACASPAAASPPCSTASSCRAAPLPAPGVFGAPASATLDAQENPVFASPATGAPRGKAPAKSGRRRTRMRKARCAKARRRAGCAKAKSRTAGRRGRLRGGERRGGGQ